MAPPQGWVVIEKFRSTALNQEAAGRQCLPQRCEAERLNTHSVWAGSQRSEFTAKVAGELGRDRVVTVTESIE